MYTNLILDNLKIEKASINDWDEILSLMEETGRTKFFSGKECFESFYLVRDPDSGKIICSFDINTNGYVSILKFLGVKKDFQGNGIGKYIVNKVPQFLKEKGIKMLFASTWEAPKFWKSTIYSEIKTEDVKDPFFREYLNELKTKFPYEYENMLRNFYVNLVEGYK